MAIIHLYRTPGISNGHLSEKLMQLKQIEPTVSCLESEICYNVEVESPLSEEELYSLKWLVSHPLKQGTVQEQPFMKQIKGSFIIEVGPRLNFSTPFSTNSVSICHTINLFKVLRFETSIRFQVSAPSEITDSHIRNQIISLLHDRMTETVYLKPIESFDHGILPDKWFSVDVMTCGRKALEEINSQLGLAFDDYDLDYYTSLFREKLGRNPTSVECFDLAQSNSEHSRHWFFKGKMIINDQEQDESLLDMIINTQKYSNKNNVIKFSDNSSAIQGFAVQKFKPQNSTEPSSFNCSKGLRHLIFTAETHNFPTGVAPFSGATTGTGGRIRDVQAVGRGGLCIAGTAGYSVGNLNIPGHSLSWENQSFKYPSNLASPLQILIQASNGASDYGNKFGEPVILGFTRSFGLIDPNGERKEWVKPIMFSGGIGCLDADMVDKDKPKKGMIVTKIGGPVYRIGVGGGSASSVQVQGDNQSELDFGAVQRGDAEMENKLNRIIRACIENVQRNPICSIHDQGAGGNGNVLKELVEPEGAIIFSKLFTLGDKSINTLELWGAEYQESNAVLIEEEDKELLMKISRRERCTVDFVGTVTGNGKVVLSEICSNEAKIVDSSNSTPIPFDLELELVLGKMPQKKFHLTSPHQALKSLSIPKNISVKQALDKVFNLISVGSKRFLTNKVDRSVTGLVAQQQCVGPIHTPLADYCVTSLSMFDNVGIASSIGEQPLKGLVNPEAAARLTISEAVTNLMFAYVSSIEDVKASGNWMWAAKLPGEGLLLYKTCRAMCNILQKLGIAIDGGKDSLSMAARMEGETIKAPGTLVVSTYVSSPDIHLGVTPDLKSPNKNDVGAILWVSLSDQARLGGSALAQTYSQLGDTCPDVEHPERLKAGFMITQKLLKERKILAGHDISDGGLITCILEMAFGGLSGLQIKFSCDDFISILFAEEVGWVIETSIEDVEYITNLYTASNLRCQFIGQSVGFGIESQVTIRNNNDVILNCSLLELFKKWEETSYKLELNQANAVCVHQEFNGLENRKGPYFHLSFNPDVTLKSSFPLKTAPKVAVLREEGSNGDREMAASLYMAGFEVWDIVMQDILDDKITIDRFRGIIFPGGFSYADTLGSAKGWAACLLFNARLKSQFDSFFNRKDSFSFGVCNGCQLMALLGWIDLPGDSNISSPQVMLDHNLSERFESRFSSVRIEKSNSIMCKGMEGSILGVWVAHGEGRFNFKNKSVMNEIINAKNVAFSYVDDNGAPTEVYPMNPNGSPNGIAGICSKDGRHLAMMPHPERCTLMWQWPYIPPNLSHLKISPWMRVFENAFVWSNENV